MTRRSRWRWSAPRRRADRPAFDRLLQEMLPADARERLFLEAGTLGRMLAV